MAACETSESNRGAARSSGSDADARGRQVDAGGVQGHVDAGRPEVFAPMPPVKQLPQPDAQRHTGPPVVHSSYAIAARNAHVDDCDFGARTRDIIRLSAD